jgi:hypothetical protein
VIEDALDHEHRSLYGLGAEPVQGFLARVSGGAERPGLQHSRNSRVDSHVSANGMADGTRVMFSACGWPPTRDPGPSRLPPGGTEVLLSSLAPAREGSGVMRWGQRRAERTGESASATWGDKATALVCCRSPSRHVPQGCTGRVRSATLPRYRIGGRSSAHGMPDRPCVVPSACAQPPSARNRGPPIIAGPSASAEYAPGPLRLIAIASGASTRAGVSRDGEAPRGFVVGRLLDGFDKEIARSAVRADVYQRAQNVGTLVSTAGA